MPGLRRLFGLWPLICSLTAGLPAFAVAPQATVTCSKCHVEARTEPNTPMGRALELPGGNPTLQSHPRLFLQKGEYSYLIETRDGKTTYTASDGTRSISVLVLWSFGTSNQTWVLERDGDLYESLVSYYIAIDGLDTTTGDESITPHTLEEAWGRKLGPVEVKTCFGCHTTNSTKTDALNLASLHPGIDCEHCHEGTSPHLANILKGKPDSIPAVLRTMSSEDTSTFCGQCHRTWETVVRGHLRGEANVRFQPYRLANSKCFDGADRRISCVACHDPHKPLVEEISFYDGKCLACHSTGSKSADAATATSTTTAKACPVAKSNCVSCHMPKVALRTGHPIFTDHEIRIVKTGQPYPN